MNGRNTENTCKRLSKSADLNMQPKKYLEKENNEPNAKGVVMKG